MKNLWAVGGALLATVILVGGLFLYNEGFFDEIGYYEYTEEGYYNEETVQGSGSINQETPAALYYPELENYYPDDTFVASQKQKITNAQGMILANSFDTDNTLFVILEAELYPYVKSEFMQYLTDLKNEGWNVIVKLFSWSETPENIKTEIVKRNAQYGLRGVILAGSIPTKYFGLPQNQYGAFPSDFYYRDLKNECGYDSAGGYYNYLSCSTSSVITDFWVGRITPPINSAERVELLKGYFNSNHKYRTGQITHNNKMLAYFPMQSEIATVEQTFYDSIDRSGVYSRNDVITAYNDNNYLAELADYNEYVIYNGHGNPTYQEENITFEDVKNAGTNSFMLDMRSCSVGRFTEENYLAGWYLFGGDAQIVLAPTTPVFGSPALSNYEIMALASGKIVGDVSHLRSSQLAPVLGDPTLKMRHASVGSGEIYVTPEIDLGIVSPDSPASIPVKIGLLNTGSRNTKIIGVVVMYKGEMKLSGNYQKPNIPAQGSAVLEYNMLPYEIESPLITGQFIIVTDHPYHTFISVPFELRAA